MKTSIFISISLLIFSFSGFAQMAEVEVRLSPAGSFVGRTSEVKGFATQKGDVVEASNVVVNLKNLATGVKVRDEHTQKHLETDKFPEAILVSATGKGGSGEGTVKIRGVEKRVSGTYKLEGKMLNAEFPIKFSDFNISGIKYMGIGVKDEGKIKVSIPVKN